MSYNENPKVSYSGVSFFELLGLLFIGLKLMGVIDWSWWYVTMPLYLPLIIVLVIFLGAIILKVMLR
jgi:hypothetical protein